MGKHKMNDFKGDKAPNAAKVEHIASSDAKRALVWRQTWPFSIFPNEKKVKTIVPNEVQIVARKKMLFMLIPMFQLTTLLAG